MITGFEKCLKYYVFYECLRSESSLKKIVVLNSLPESNSNPEVQNLKPQIIFYEKRDSTQYLIVQTRPDPKPDKVWPVPALGAVVERKVTDSMTAWF